MIHGYRIGLVTVATAAMLLLTVTTTFAQRPERPQERPGAGPRGPGGPQRSFFGQRGPSSNWIALLGSEKVQQELEILDDQKEALTKAGDEIREQMREVFSGFRGLRELSEEERQKKTAEIRQKAEAVGKQVRAKLEEILLPHQIDRLKQISIQVRGVGALNDPEVAKSLGITEEQKEQIQEIRDKNREKAQEMFAAARGADEGDREGIREKFEKLRADSNEETLATLSSEQRAQFEQMQGEKIEIDRSQLFRRRGGGRGSRRPGDGDGRPRRPGGAEQSNPDA